MGAVRAAMKRVPLIKFPHRHPPPPPLSSSGTSRQVEGSIKDEALATDEVVQKFFSRVPSSMSVGGKASDQPRRTPVTQEEIEAVMLGGCI